MFLGDFFRASKKVLFSEGPDPYPPHSGRDTKKTVFAASLRMFCVFQKHGGGRGKRRNLLDGEEKFTFPPE